MSEKTISKEQYLEELVTNAAKKIAEGTTPQTTAIMVPCWTKVIMKEVRPILKMLR